MIINAFFCFVLLSWVDARSRKKMCRVICCPGGPISLKHILHLETENSSLK